mmetsp:Transcript_7941/g.23523  ORF Transcript_7941/g.23523 Transcript_7941/m.23523 type:complete len:249 (-) Transcript_7941:1810-2556(-)
MAMAADILPGTFRRRANHRTTLRQRCRYKQQTSRKDQQRRRSGTQSTHALHEEREVQKETWLRGLRPPAPPRLPHRHLRSGRLRPVGRHRPPERGILRPGRLRARRRLRSRRRSRRRRRRRRREFRRLRGVRTHADVQPPRSAGGAGGARGRVPRRLSQPESLCVRREGEGEGVLRKHAEGRRERRREGPRSEGESQGASAGSAPYNGGGDATAKAGTRGGWYKKCGRRDPTGKEGCFVRGALAGRNR